jgi:hypothetical protein
MERKYYLVETGKEVKLGDDIAYVQCVKTPFGKLTSVSQVPFTLKTKDTFITLGIVKEKATGEEGEDAPYTLDDIVQSIADSWEWEHDKLVGFLNKISRYYPAATLSILLRAIAKKFDKKYDNHISESEHIYVISLTNGEISEVDKKTIISYDHFAAFRSKKDARRAKYIMRTFFDAMYGEQKD